MLHEKICCNDHLFFQDISTLYTLTFANIKRKKPLLVKFWNGLLYLPNQKRACWWGEKNKPMVIYLKLASP